MIYGYSSSSPTRLFFTNGLGETRLGITVEKRPFIRKSTLGSRQYHFVRTRAFLHNSVAIQPKRNKINQNHKLSLSARAIVDQGNFRIAHPIQKKSATAGRVMQ